MEGRIRGVQVPSPLGKRRAHMARRLHHSCRLLEDDPRCLSREARSAEPAAGSRSFGDAVMAQQQSLRAIVCAAAKSGVPTPGLMAALGYFDAYRSAWSFRPTSCRPRETTLDLTPMSGSMPRGRFTRNGRRHECHDELPTLHELGQSLWLDNITRGLLESGTLKRYLRDLAVTGLTSNPTIFDHAIRNTSSMTRRLLKRPPREDQAKTLFFDLALEDLTRRPPISFAPSMSATTGVDGWVSLEVSPSTCQRRGGHNSRSRTTPCARTAAESLHQDSRHPCGPHRNRGIDFRRSAGQRDAAVLSRAIPCRGCGVHARNRAADRRRA